jgi:hypothetical protein
MQWHIVYEQNKTWKKETKHESYPFHAIIQVGNGPPAEPPNPEPNKNNIVDTTKLQIKKHKHTMRHFMETRSVIQSFSSGSV